MPRQNQLPVHIDHLVYTAVELERGMDVIEEKLGVRPVMGGRHPGAGTQNALLSLGPKTYLEVIAPDPEAERPERGYWFDFGDARTGGLSTWVMRAQNIDAAAVKARDAGVNLGAVLEGARDAPGGGTLSWQLTDPYAERLGGAVPFLIHWGDTPHPAATAPHGGRLIGLRAEHPDPELLSGVLGALGTSMDVRAAARPRLIATIESKNGRIELGV